MKRISFCILLLLIILPSISVAQNTKKMQQAVTLLKTYNKKAYQAIQDVINCSDAQVCTSALNEAIATNGILRAALKTIQLTSFPLQRKK